MSFERRPGTCLSVQEPGGKNRNGMNRKAIPLFVAIGYLLLFAAGYLFFLFASNLRSRNYYHAPNYSFLFWLFLYSSITAFGLMRLRKWAVLSLFLPGILELFHNRFGRQGRDVYQGTSLLVP